MSRRATKVAFLLSCALVSSACSRSAIVDRFTSAAPADGGARFDGGGVDGDASAALLDVMPRSVDLGLVDCGARPASPTVTIQNAGTRTLRYFAVLSPSRVLRLNGASARGELRGELGPGERRALTIDTFELPREARAGSALEATLEITSNALDGGFVSVPIRLTPRGATLVVTPDASAPRLANAVFGAAPIGEPASPIELRVENLGNAAARFTIGEPSNEQFGLVSDELTRELGSGDALALTATFEAQTSGEARAVATIALDSDVPVCGASAAAISFAGVGTAADVTASPGGVLDFGDVLCDTTDALAKTVVLTNRGDVPYGIRATLGAGASSPFEIQADSSTVPAARGATPGTLALTVVPRIALSSATPGSITDVLTIAPSSASWGDPIAIDVTMQLRGAVLTFDDTPPPFTQVLAGSEGRVASVGVRNDGNLEASPALVLVDQSNASAPFSIESQLSSIAPGASITGSVRYRPASLVVGSDSALLALMLGSSDHVCGGVPEPLALVGSSVTDGQLSIGDVTDLWFGDDGYVRCGEGAAAPQSITLRNEGGTELRWTATLAKGSASWFTLPESDQGALGPGETVDLIVSPKALPYPASTAPDFYGDTLTISSNAPDDVTHVVTLHQTARGAVLALDPNALAFGSVPVGPLDASASGSLTLHNQGNSPAIVSLATRVTDKPSGVTSTAGFFFADGTTERALDLLAASSSNASLRFVPGIDRTQVGAWTGTLAVEVDPSTVLCADLPSASLSGTGTASNVVASPSSDVVFTGAATGSLPTPPPGMTYCGTTAANQTVTLVNTGNAAVTITELTLGAQTGASAACGNASTASAPYCLTSGSASEGSVLAANGGTASLVLASKPVPFPFTAFDSDPFEDTLTLGLRDEGGNEEQRVFALVQSPYGAVLTSFSPPASAGVSTLSFPATPAGGSSALPMAIENAGNAPATVRFTALTSSVPAAFALDQATVGAFSTIPPNPPPFSAWFTPPAGTFATITGTANFGVTSGTPLCAPLPLTSVVLTGTSIDAPSFLVSPSSITFSDIPCGATLANAPSTTLTITNTTASSVSWSASIPANANGTSFGLSASGGTIAAGDTAQLVVTAAPVPPSASFTTSLVYSTTLSLTVGGTSFSIPVTEQAVGAVLSFRPLDGTMSLRRNRTRTFALRNAGNRAAEVTLTNTPVSGGAQLTISPTLPETVTLGAQGSGSARARFEVSNTSAQGVRGRTTVSLATSDPVCKPLPTLTISTSPPP